MKWVLIYINTNLNIPVITIICSPRSNQNDFPWVIVMIKQVQECAYSFNTQITCSHILQKHCAFKKAVSNLSVEKGGLHKATWNLASGTTCSNVSLTLLLILSKAKITQSMITNQPQSSKYAFLDDHVFISLVTLATSSRSVEN